MIKKIFVFAFIGLFLASYCFAAQQANIAKHIIFKGLNTKSGPLSMDEGDSPDCMNVHTSIFGTLIKRNGYSKLNTAHAHVTTSPGKVNGLYDYAKDSSTRYLMSYFDNQLYKMDSLDGNFDRVTTPTNFSNNLMFFENFDGTLIMTTLSRDFAQKWDGSGSTSHLQITPKGKYQIKAYNRWFVSDCDDGTGTIYPLRFYYTEPGTFETIATYETLDANAGDVAMGWGVLKGRLVGFTKYTVNIVTDAGGNDPIFVDRRVDGTGCGASRSIKTINHPKYGESLVWLTEDKRLVLWNGSSLIDIGEKVQSNNKQCVFYLNAISSVYLYKAHAQVYEKEGWYVLFIPLSTSIDYALIYDYKTDTLWPYSAQNFNSSALVSTSSGNLIYAGEETGGVFRWDNGTNDNASNINGYWTSAKWIFDFMPSLKKMGEIQIVLKTVGNYNLSFQDRFNFDNSWSTAENLLMYNSEWLLGDNLPIILGGSQAVIHRIDIDRNFNLYQVKLSSNSTDPAFEVYSIDLVTEKLGVGE